MSAGQRELVMLEIAPCKGNRIPESGKFGLVESVILGFGMWNTSQRIRNPTSDWNPESRFRWQRLESIPGIRNPWRGIQNQSLSWIPLELVLERSSIFSFPHRHHFALAAKKSPRVLFPYVRSTISKEKIRGSVKRLQKLKLLFRCWLFSKCPPFSWPSCISRSMFLDLSRSRLRIPHFPQS